MRLHNGYEFIEQFEPNKSTEAIAAEIGHVLHIENIPLVQLLKPLESKKSTKNLYSGNFGLDSFPLHTDLAHWFVPPRYILLRCIEGAENVFTSVLAIDNLLENLNKTTISKAMFKPRKKIKGKFSLLKFRQRYGSDSIYRWDSIFLMASNYEAQEIKLHLQKVNKKQRFHKLYFQNKGDTLLIDNWATFHGRGPITIGAQNRKIERVYLSEIFS